MVHVGYAKADMHICDPNVLRRTSMPVAVSPLELWQCFDVLSSHARRELLVCTNTTRRCSAISFQLRGHLWLAIRKD